MSDWLREQFQEWAGITIMGMAQIKHNPLLTPWPAQVLADESALDIDDAVDFLAFTGVKNAREIIEGSGMDWFTLDELADLNDTQDDVRYGGVP